MKYEFLPQFSNTGGEMWVSLGRFATLAEARSEIRGYCEAGNATRIVKCPILSGDDFRGIDRLLADRVATIVG